MILTAHQSAFLPWCGLIAKIASADVFVQFDEVPLERHGFSNRNKILTHNGEQWLTVPVRLDDHLSKPISQIEMMQGNWRRKHLRTIELAYQKAPYFENIYPELVDLYFPDALNDLAALTYLADFNSRILRWILFKLEIDTRIIQARDLNLTGSKSDLVLDMCLKLKADKYIFGAQGMAYAEIDKFADLGIKLEFQAYNHPVYKQLHGSGFVPNMSVIDVMFNHGPDSRKIILGEA